MSENINTSTTNIAILMQNNPSLVEMGLDEDTLAVAGGLGGASKRISIKGGVFRKIVGGKEIGTIEDRHMNIIFVKMAHKASRQYYSQGYQEGVKASPVCWSQDSETPDPEVRNPPASTCKTCSFSVRGSSSTGLGSACRLSWRTAVVLPNDLSGDIMQLVLPATSCFGDEVNGKHPFRPYVQLLANNNISAGRVITKMQFDTASPVPKVLFSPIGAVSPEDVPKIILQSRNPLAENALKLTVFHRDEFQPAVVQREYVQEEPKAGIVEPKLQNSKPEVEEPSVKQDVASIISKWAKKKGS